MKETPFHVTSLAEVHDRTTFDSGAAPLNIYFHRQVSQDIRRRVAACFVALTHDHCVADYYMLASTSLLLSDLPPAIGKKLPRYPLVPAVRMGRLAVDRHFKGQGLGGALLADAFDRSFRSEITAYALVVDAKDAAAASFYLHHGFIALPDSPLTLFLPLATVQGM